MAPDRTRPIFALLALTLALLLVGGCSTATPPTVTSGGVVTRTVPATSPPIGGIATIMEAGATFAPATVSLQVGDAVSFVNNDSTAHEVSIDGKSLGIQAPGVAVTWKATKVGTFPFACLIHPAMKGDLTVK